MGNYTAYEWLAFFLVYAFLGWVWESCYVSVKQGKWDRCFQSMALVRL